MRLSSKNPSRHKLKARLEKRMAFLEKFIAMCKESVSTIELLRFVYENSDSDFEEANVELARAIAADMREHFREIDQEK